MATTRHFPVQINLPDTLPEDIQPVLHVFDTHGKFITTAKIPRDGTTRVRIPKELQGAALRFVTSPKAEREPTLKQLRRINAVETIRPFNPDAELAIDIADAVIAGWILCVCTVRGKVVKAVSQPSGGSVDYPVCNAKVHICEVDKIPKIIWKIPDDIIFRVRDELLVEPFPPDPIGPVIRRIPRELPDPPAPPGPPGPIDRPLASVRNSPPTSLRFSATALNLSGNESFKDSAAVFTNLRRAPNTVEMRKALVELAVLYPWWCWYPWLDPYFTYEVDCWWEVWTDSSGSFEKTFVHSCADTPDIYLWVEQFIAGSWKTIYARGPRCDTHWNYACGTEITIRVTHPDAIVCVPPPEVVVPGGITTWVLPMAVGALEIAGASSHASDALGWVQTDGTASYAGPSSASNVAPVMDAPLGGYLRFKMLHSLDLPKAGMTRYAWSYRLKPSPNPAVPGGWIKMDETVVRKYQVPGPSGFPIFPVYPLGPDADGLFDFRPHSPPAGVWPVTGFTEDLWSAKLQTLPMATGLYQVQVTVHDATGAVVPPSAGTFQFVVTDNRDSSKETYDTRAAAAAELIDDGFVFDVRIDNASCTAQLHPVQTSVGAVADACGFLRYADKSLTDVTLSFEASHPRDQAWFTLDLVRGSTDLNQVEVGDGGLVGALSVPVDSNGVPPWTNAFYTGDGAGNFSGTFSASRFLEACDNAAFAADLYARAKAHSGLRRLYEYDRHSLMAFALAEEPAAP